MFVYKILFLVLVASVHSRVLKAHRHYVVDTANIFDKDYEDTILYPFEHGVKQVQIKRDAVSPSEVARLTDEVVTEERDSPRLDNEISRVRRQVHGKMNTNPDGSYNIAAGVPLATGSKNMLSAVGSLEGLKKDQGFQAAGGGLLLENINGHSLSMTGRHIPGAGNQLTAAATANLLNTGNHKLDGTAFATHSMPKVGENFNTFGGKMDYMYKDRIGGSLGMSHTDLFKKTDYSAMGNLNLFKTPTSSFDLSAGYQKSVSPYMPHSSWQPTFMGSFTKRF